MMTFHCTLILILLAISSSRALVKLVGTPVVFTNNAGGGPDELQVPPDSDGSKLFDAGSAVLAAWWVPFDNIADLPAINRIDAVPQDTHVNLVVHGFPGQRDARVRIKLFADISG